MYVFITVNYATSSLLKNWTESINRCYKGEKKIIVVDNYSNNNERKNIVRMSNELNFEYILSENNGYGNGLNLAFEYLLLSDLHGDYTIFAGNMDIIFKYIPKKITSKKCAYIPIALENNKNKNPFLTNLQKKFLVLHKLTLKTDSVYVLYSIVFILKILSIFKSKPWAVHGSMFIFNGNILKKGQMIFNNDSFLYSEELEFASYLETNRIPLIDSEIIYEHIQHAATKEIILSSKDFIKVWKPSFSNWITRWKI